MKVKILIHNEKPNVFGLMLDESDMIIETTVPTVFHDEFNFTEYKDTFNIELYHEEIWDLVKC